MKDNFDREINYMRISVTDRCNFRCKYCMPKEGVADIGHDRVLSFEEIQTIVKAAAELGITKFRLTGGEPLVRAGIVELVSMIKSIEGVEELAMTTNGSLLKEYAKDLKEAGLDRINIGIDTLRYMRFGEITRGGSLDDVVAGINEAVNVGLTPIKLNVVVMRDFNDDEILDFLQLTFQHDYEVRFVELMPIGMADCGYEFVSNEEIKKKMPGLRPFPGTEAGELKGVAQMYKYSGARGKIGFISPISCAFCEKCDRVRLTSDGKLKPCLDSDFEVDLRHTLGDPELLKKTIVEAINSKNKGHSFATGKSHSGRNMNEIGG